MQKVKKHNRKAFINRRDRKSSKQFEKLRSLAHVFGDLCWDTGGVLRDWCWDPCSCRNTFQIVVHIFSVSQPAEKSHNYHENPEIQGWAHSFCNSFQSLVLAFLQNVIFVQIQLLEFPLHQLMIPDASKRGPRFCVFGVKDIQQGSVESYTIVRRTFFSGCTDACWWWSLQTSFAAAVGSTMVRMSFLNDFSLSVNTPATVILETLNRCERSVFSTSWDELYFRALWKRVRPRCHAAIWSHSMF